MGDLPPEKTGNVTPIEAYRNRPRRKKQEPPRAKCADFDAVTRDLHAAASTTLKMIYLVRDALGLPKL